MRALLLAIAMTGVAGASAAGVGHETTTDSGDLILSAPMPPAPAGVRKQAEGAVKDGLASEGSAQYDFRAEGVRVATSVKHGAFGQRVAGPVSVVCGQYNARNRTGGDSGYAWFYVAIKDGQVLWADLDEGSDSGVAYYSCKGAGLAS
jgi:hypothetical protein